MEKGFGGGLWFEIFGFVFFGILLLVEIGDEEEFVFSVVNFSGWVVWGDSFLGIFGDLFLF